MLEIFFTKSVIIIGFILFCIDFITGSIFFVKIVYKLVNLFFKPFRLVRHYFKHRRYINNENYTIASNNNEQKMKIDPSDRVSVGFLVLGFGSIIILQNFWGYIIGLYMLILAFVYPLIVGYNEKTHSLKGKCPYCQSLEVTPVNDFSDFDCHSCKEKILIKNKRYFHKIKNY